MSRKGRRSGAKRSRTPWIILSLVVVLAVVAYFIFTLSGAGSSSPLNGQPVSQTVLSQLSGVSTNTLNAVGGGPGGVNPTKPITSSTPLTFNGKPEVLYMGAEYCPYCAAERWAMIVAFDKFGSFTGLQYMQSAPLPESFPNTPTFTFRNATYTSNYISFVSVEQRDRNNQPLQTATSDQIALMNTYDNVQPNPGAIPFIDFGNAYAVIGSSYSPAVLRPGGSATAAPYDWTQISAQLDNSSSIFAQNIDGAANRMISAICKIDGGKPSSVCSQSFAQVLSYVINSPSGGPQLLVSDAVPRWAPSSAAAGRYAPNRPIAHV
jgi:thiol-disulfide isomerase/thioredoxin